MNATADWKATARALAPTHSRHETALLLGVPYSTLKSWARREGVEFKPAYDPLGPDRDEVPDVEEMDDGFRLALLGRLYRAELGVVPGDRLYRLTARPEPDRDVAAALARLVAA